MTTGTGVSGAGTACTLEHRSPQRGSRSHSTHETVVRRDAGKELLGLLWISTEMPLGTLTLLFAL